ncbi:MAG TPA: MarR family transcriptional regulator [Steroidobacteraceae bacterium]
MTTPLKMTPTIQRCVLHWGEMAGRWGISRSVAQIHAVLFLSPEPLIADDIAGLLGIARSNVSVSLKELQTWDLVSITHVLGDRRDYFQARKDIWDVLTTIMDQRKRREIDPTLQLLRDCAVDAKRDHETPEQIKERLATMLEFLEEMTGWYDQVRNMPRPTLLKLMRMGNRVAKVVS